MFIVGLIKCTIPLLRAQNNAHFSRASDKINFTLLPRRQSVRHSPFVSVEKYINVLFYNIRSARALLTFANFTSPCCIFSLHNYNKKSVCSTDSREFIISALANYYLMHRS